MLKRTISLALLASAMITSSFASTATTGGASLPTLNINGSTVMNAYAAHNSAKGNDTKRDYHFANDVSDLFFTIRGQTSNGLQYGYKMGIQAFSGGSPTFQQNYVEFNGKFGTVQFGNVVGPEDSMIDDGGSVVGGTGTFDGGYHNIALIPAFVMRGNDNIGDTGYATKIAYYTPSMRTTAGDVRFGIAFTPDTSKAGDNGADGAVNSNPNAPGNRTFLPNKKLYPYDLNSLAFGLSFKKDWNNWALNLNGAYITGDAYYGVIEGLAPNAARRTQARRTSAYQLGAVVGYRRHNGHLLQLGVGYLNNGKSRLEKSYDSVKNNNYANLDFSLGDLYQGNSGQAWNAALGYVMGIYKFSASYQGTERKTDATNKVRSNLFSVTADVVPVGGLKFYVEADYLKARSNATAVATAGAIARYKNDAPTRAQDNQVLSNHATVVIIGTKVSF